MHTIRRNQGIALITAIAFLVITLALVGTALVVTTTNLRLSRSNSQTIQTQLAAESGIDAAVARVWHGAAEQVKLNKQQANDESPIDVLDYRVVWDDEQAARALGLSAALLAGEEEVNGETVPAYGTPITLDGAVQVRDSDVGYDLTVERIDLGDGESRLRIVSTSAIKNDDGEIIAQRRLAQELFVGFPPFSLDFALLSDFINCTFCHSAFISIEAAYDKTNNIGANYARPFQHLNDLVPLTDPTKWQAVAKGTERIRVAGLNNLVIPISMPNLNTLVGGTIYTRGRFNPANGERTQNIMHASDCQGSPLAAGKCGVYVPFYQDGPGGGSSSIISDTWGSTVARNRTGLASKHLLSCTENPNDGNTGCEEKNARFYESYPSDNESVPPIDGKIPQVESFPSPIPDGNNDRIIDNTEWVAAVRRKPQGRFSSGNIWFSPTDTNRMPLDTGNQTFTITIPINGNIGNGPNRQRISLPMFRGAAAVNAARASSGGRGIPGNLILLGKDNDPIAFNGSIYVDGDVVIAGPIAPGNNGVILARGNIYVVGDVIYDCNGTSSGTNCDYTKPNTLPRFGLVAAGSIIVGDPAATRSAGQIGNSNNALADVFRIRNTIQSQAYALQGEVASFNRFQFQRAASTPGFIPRYYISRQGDQLIWRCTTVECIDYTSARGSFNALTNTNNPRMAGQITASTASGATSMRVGNTRGVVMALSPTNHWLTPAIGANTNGRPNPDDADDPAYNPTSPNPGLLGAVGSRNSAAVIGMSGSLAVTSPWDDTVGVGLGPLGYGRNKQAGEVRAIISESVITTLWNQNGNLQTSEGRSTSAPRPLQFDGLLYTNNAILNFQPHRGPTGGGWIVNGSIISFETGLLVYGLLERGRCRPGNSSNGIGNNNLFTSKRNYRCVGLRVQYDKRLIDLIDIRQGEPVLTRLRSQFLEIND